MHKKNTDADDRKNISMSGKRLVVSLLVLAFVVFAYAVFSGAWFAIGKSAKAEGMHINIQSISSKDFVLYRWDSTLNSNQGGWQSVDSIDMSLTVPNECERYMVISPTEYDSVKFSLNSFNDNETNPANENLYDYIYINKVEEQTTEVTPSAYGSALPAEFGYADCALSSAVSASISQSGTYALSTTSSKTVVFDIYVSKDVCNYFSTWSFSGSVIVE